MDSKEYINRIFYSSYSKMLKNTLETLAGIGALGKIGGPLAKKVLTSLVKDGDANLEEAARMELQDLEFDEDEANQISISILSHYTIEYRPEIICGPHGTNERDVEIECGNGVKRN